MIRGSTQLIRAAIQNDLPRVLQLVQLGAPIHLVVPGCLWAALEWACSFGRKAIASALLDGKFEGCGAELDRANLGCTPLSIACKVGYEGVASLLLDRGAKQELRPEHGYTALFYAVGAGHSRVITLLSTAPGFAAALQTTGYHGLTPLAWAIEMRREACEAILRSHGATL